MRLPAVDDKHALREKLFLLAIRVVSGEPAPGVAKTLRYRPGFFGKRHSALTQRVMRGPSYWSVAERELFAAYVSRVNQCPFCVGAHAASAAEAYRSKDLVERVLDDPDSAPIDARLRAALRLLRKVTLEHDSVGVGDVRSLRSLGISSQGVRDALYVAYLFNVYNRLGDALGWDVPSDATFDRLGKFLMKRGYG